MKVALVVNRRAGYNRAARVEPYLLRQFEASGIEFVEIAESSVQAAMDRVQELIAEIDAIVAVGGDGTVHTAAQLAWRHAIPLGIVAAGSGDDIAQGCGLPFGRKPADVERAVDHLVAALLAGERAAVDGAVVTTPEGAARLVLAIAGCGFDTRVSVIADRITFPRGTARYIYSLFRTLSRFEPIKFRLELDGESKELEGILADTANAPTFGGGMRLAPAARMNDGELDLVFLHKVSMPVLLFLFTKIFNGTHVSHPAVEIWRARSLFIDAPGEQIWGDGEFIAHSPVAIRVQPSAIQVVGARF